MTGSRIGRDQHTSSSPELEESGRLRSPECFPSPRIECAYRPVVHPEASDEIAPPSVPLAREGAPANALSATQDPVLSPMCALSVHPHRCKQRVARALDTLPRRRSTQEGTVRASPWGNPPTPRRRAV